MCTNHLFLSGITKDASTPDQACCLGGRLEEEENQLKSYKAGFVPSKEKSTP